MSEPKITYVRFHNPMPIPATLTRAIGSRKELDAKHVDGPIRASERGVTYAHPHYGMILVPWTSVHHCRVEAAPAEDKPKPKRRGRPPKAKPE